MKKSWAYLSIALAFLLLSLCVFGGEKPPAGNIAVATDEKTPGSNVSDRMGRSRFYVIYDAQGTFVGAVDNPNFGKGPRVGEGKSGVDSITFDDKGVMTGGLPTPTREERDQTWKGFGDFFARNGISFVVAGQFGDEIVRAMKAGGVTCVEFNGKAEDAVGKVVQLQKQKEAAQ